jgi:two-component system nitrogen regulation response regulator GlnG
MATTTGRPVALRVLPPRWAGLAQVDPPELVGALALSAPAPLTGEAALVFPEGYVPGNSAAMQELYGQMRVIARGDVPVLLLGETGVGKEKLAHALHASSPRRSGPFVAVNCAALPAELLEAEMFGIAKGVATGVVERPGKFQLASGGTLFLDEIGDMPLALQAKLLRALQGQEITPVGGSPVRVDTRVVTSTNSDLDARIEQGLFRRDLYYRVAGFVLRVPALRERRDDIPGLVDSLLEGFARTLGRRVPAVTPEALRALAAHAWPGNIRELEHEVRRLAYLCPAGEPIDSRMLSESVLLGKDRDSSAPPSSLKLDANIAHLERKLIQAALLRTGGRRSPAARLLGISRNGLAMKMERLGLGNVIP